MAHVPASERRPQLIRAAIDLMTREGVSAGSTRAIAAELGVAQATVHYTFGTKKDLYRAVVEQLTADVMEQVHSSAPAEGPFEEQVRAMVDGLWESSVGAEGRCVLLEEFAALALRDPDLQEIMSGLQKRTEETATAIISGVAEAHGLELALPAHELAIQFLAGFDGLVTRYLVLRRAGEQADEEAARQLDLLVATMIGLCLGRPARTS
ncbi:TetR/AcrR family transcriptional regulator [Kitasatospora acidiphila]|uniref:TetR/AcrR family transcriptional regulator n=1 Tax=Kitasatospora acidiphila TaxID=2567942 RepID=A0A540VWT9_9ACTN|nr:TetR/AcrR family transcriptional regulator [Kitasatospora acidiphila]TQF01233.1 TetR/AcrR family transcriptional regulator [Kitasatospora acidiphila]